MTRTSNLKTRSLNSLSMVTNPYNVWWDITFQENTWYHLAVVYSKSAKTSTLYVNGKKIQTAKYSRANQVRLDDFDIGSWVISEDSKVKSLM